YRRSTAKACRQGRRAPMKGTHTMTNIIQDRIGSQPFLQSGAIQRPDRNSRNTLRATNVSLPGRIASVLGGGALAASGLPRGTLRGIGLSLLGGALAYRGVTGHCPLLARLGINTAARPEGPVASVPAGRGVKVDEMIVIRRPPAELFRFWRNLEN